MIDTYLGSCGPRGGRVLSKVKTYFQDTYDYALVHFTMTSWFGIAYVWHEMVAHWWKFGFYILGLLARSLMVEIMVCTADKTQLGRNSCSVFRMWVFAGFSGHGNLINL